MVVEYEKPRLPKEKIDGDKFYSDFQRIFSGITKNQLDALWDVCLEATNQKHGTMLVISDKAIEESQRLAGQCFVVKPFQLTMGAMQQITSIDGAVLMDRDCTCHAMGVILDGMATKRGNPARGARYNSAIRYFESCNTETSLAIVIVSEDGMINLIPDLKPQIKHSLIMNKIEEFKRLFDMNEYDHKSFCQLQHYFENCEFYLSQYECEEINLFKNKIEEKFASQLPNFRIIRHDLKPNDLMNESYYLPEK
jgi:hypothetical protein